MTHLSNVTWSLWPSIIPFRGSCETDKQIVPTQSNCLSCAKMLTQQTGIKTLWPGTTMCQMLAETMWKPRLVWSHCTQLQATQTNNGPVANLTPWNMQSRFSMFALQHLITSRVKSDMKFSMLTGWTSIAIISVHANLSANTGTAS